MIDYFQLASGILVLLASAIPFFMAARVFKLNKSFFFMSALLGITLIVHGTYRLMAVQGETLMGSELELLSALLVLSVAVCYTYLRGRPR